MKKALLSLLLTAGFLLHGIAQNVTVVVTTHDGMEQTIHLTDAGQLYFEDGERLVIEDGNGASSTFQLADIRKLVCAEVNDVDENATSDILLIPNPSRDHFFLSHLQRSCEARLYALDGRLIRSFTATEGMMVDISDLAPGMYLLHIDSQTLKMMKL